ncbi:NADH-quinone oxidoreductase subunit L [Thermocrinis minervae]|uniref:NADH-quinone oxidoreductase subunit L n=1 Tax=Thermocrinis minervae TaxID=381751 RepID=A0A1M6TMZ2_9AQUI|nr:NADH-quinone oxidoreductase subunit L [Thermocrinis minervae]SHK58317.1 NADH-quinone oxidoreductase subunit L [Thermocrinis minervae]
MEHALILFSPLVSFVLVGLLGRRIGDLASAILTILGGAFAFIFSLQALPKALQNPIHIKLYEFLPLGNYTLSLGIYLDALSSITTSVVTFVATLIFIYSIGYMENLFGQWTYKFYAYLSLFLFAMLLIVLSDNLLGIFVGWEGVGLASYLLIGYFHTQKKATNASLEAFVLNRIGDWFFIFGVIFAFYLFGSLELPEIFQKTQSVDKNLLGLCALLLFGGSVGKSGQLPLHTWLPNAMAGPTPVSALLHAATMVAAGVYLVARVYPVFESAPESLKVVLVVGSLTALFAALAATSHTDIKKIIAFSTMSQLGLMYVALGVGNKVAAMFHLTTHAFFKALLFLAAGSVIHSFHHKVHDIYEVGALKRYMPVTYGMFLVGALALAGVFPLSGFWSKDMILASAYGMSFALGVLVSFVSLLTAYYIFREFFVMFYGEERSEEEPHESPPVMLVPMLVLAVFAVFAGFAHGVYSELFGHKEELHLNIALISTFVALTGIALAYMVFVRRSPDPEKLYQALKPLHTTLKEQFFTEKLYHKVLAAGYMNLSKGLFLVVDRVMIDGFINLLKHVFLKGTRFLWMKLDIKVVDLLVNGLAKLAFKTGNKTRNIQTGLLNNYVTFLLVGIIIILAVIILSLR